MLGSSKQKNIWILCLFILLVFLGIIAIWHLSKSNEKLVIEQTSITDSFRELLNANNNSTPTPTPDPFIELTIPYLRTRSYTSLLGDMQKISENAAYTSYLTSYDSDGLKIAGLLTIPKSSIREHNKHPAIVFVHGYIPPKSYQTQVNYASYVDFLARNGFVVFKIDLRGHGNSEGEAGGGYYSSDYVIDTLNARAALESSEYTNPNQIGLWGHSMAGNVIFRAFAAQPQIPAVVIWAGAGYTYTDLGEFGIDDNSYRPPPSDSERQRKRTLLRELHGDFDEESIFWMQVVPTNYLTDMKGAVQIHHATDDNVVSVEYSRNLMKILDETHIPHELHEYTSGGHNMTGSSFNQAMQRTVDFFKKNLQ